MKSISGKTTSTKKISLSRASGVLSKFLRADIGFPQAVSSYLRRTSASFDELLQLHKELKPSKRDRKPKKLKQDTSTLDVKTVKKEENEGSESTRRKKKRKSEDSSSKKETKRRRIKEED